MSGDAGRRDNRESRCSRRRSWTRGEEEGTGGESNQNCAPERYPESEVAERIARDDRERDNI